MRRSLSASSRRSCLAALAAACLMALAARAGAADVETRVFSVSVDAKKAGDYRMTIQRNSDGSVGFTGQSNVNVTVLGISMYSYSYTGNEAWKDGKLCAFQSSGKEKGKEFKVSARLDGDALVVTANGQQRRVRADAWPTSCWQLPGAAYRNGPVTLLGCDSGAEMGGRLQFVGSEQISVCGQTQTCSHYRVTKEETHDVWYDAQERLVRDEWQSGSHRTVIEMVELKR
jgi:hypothetical protein